MSEEPDVLEMLEHVKTLTQQGVPAPIDQIAHRMGRSVEAIRILLNAATRKGLTNETERGFLLSDAGEDAVRKHREEYVHRAHFHRRSMGDRVRRLLEGRISDWRGHWRRHGFDDETLTAFYRNMQNLPGRVEETLPLADLHAGEKCTIVLPLGGHGMVRRLAEMGLTPGTEVRVVRSAPMRGPIEVSLRGVSLALGRGIASRVLVKRSKNDQPTSNS